MFDLSYFDYMVHVVHVSYINAPRSYVYKVIKLDGKTSE